MTRNTVHHQEAAALVADAKRRMLAAADAIDTAVVELVASCKALRKPPGFAHTIRPYQAMPTRRRRRRRTIRAEAHAHDSS
jgi:hypothetical protein